jgi:hypothetical protein
MGKDAVYLHTSTRPLEEAVADQMVLFEEDTCDSGYCWT